MVSEKLENIPFEKTEMVALEVFSEIYVFQVYYQ